MGTRKFEDYLAKRLSKSEIAQIKRQARVQFQALKVLQQDISQVVDKYMKEESIGFNELVRRLGVSSAQVVKIQKGQANLTLASLAHIATLFGYRPHLVFEEIR